MSGTNLMNTTNLLRVFLLLVGIHSILLGGTIYFFTIPFYQFFFSVDPDNFFFIKQAGVFLFLVGLFYLVPAIDLKRYKIIIALIVISKITAVTFLLINARLAPTPLMIYLAAVGDGLMAAVISILTLIWYKNINVNALG